MKFRKTAALIAAVAVTAAPAAMITASPAHAAPVLNQPTITTLDAPTTNPVTWGDDVRLTGSVKLQSGASVYYGLVTLMALPVGAAAWAPIATAQSSGYLSFTVAPATSTSYRLVYTPAPSPSGDTYLASQSLDGNLGVARKYSINHKNLTMWGKVTPKFANKKLLFKIKKGKKYVKWFTVRTNGKGKWKKTVQGRDKTRFMIIIPASNGFVASADPYIIRRY